MANFLALCISVAMLGIMIALLGHLLEVANRREYRLITQWKGEKEEHEQQLLKLREFLKLATSVAATVATWNERVRSGRLCLGPDAFMTVSVDPDAEDGPCLLVQCGTGEEIPETIVFAAVGLNGVISLKIGRSCFRRSRVYTAEDAAKQIHKIVDGYFFFDVRETAS